jgi:hypothetical protein
MIRRRPFVLGVAAFGAVLQAWGSEPEVTPIIRFGNPADAVRVMPVKASLSRLTGTRVNAGGIAAQVDFELADWPEVKFRATEEPADWSGIQALVDLVVRVDDEPCADGDKDWLTGRARVCSGEAEVLILPLQSTDALPMGMRAGPPPDVPRLDAPVRVIGGRRGAVDRRHITAIHLILLERSSGRTLILGDPEPMTTRDIALEMLVTRSLDKDDQKLLALMTKRVGVALRLERLNSVVRLSSGPGKFMLWEIAV